MLHRFRKQLGNERGVTLVELLVVVAIIAILSVGAFFAFGGVQARAADGRGIDLFNQVRRVLVIIRTQEGTYPGAPGTTLTWADLATHLQAYEPGIPADQNARGVDLTEFSYQEWTAGGGFTMIGRVRNGTAGWLCADPNGVRAGLASAPALTGPCPP
jgi:prepilin-type N-terminal cleavage/methylation domain-containing protein